MACRFPGGAHSPQQFWQRLAAGTDAIIDVPPDRWNSERFYHPDPDQPGKMYIRQGGFLQQPLAAFDAAFFRMTPREAEQLDPQQRLLLEVTRETFDDAGYTPARWQGAPVGVYMGAFTMDHMGQQLAYFHRDHISTHTGMSTTMVMLSNRLSYLFDLRGPSLTVDTACSSSLVALHLACQALQQGDCALALAGGVNIMFRPEFVIAMSKGRFLSPGQRSRTFDATADGYVRGEGAGVLLLKPLPQARADGDRIHAIIAATGVNQDGHTESITLPGGAAQVALMRQVWARAGITPDDIAYIEAHGTGTQAGDITEAQSLGAALAGRATPCPVGSVKTGIGHLEAAAGIAGVIKAILCLQQRQLPPHLHLHTVNPHIDLAALNLQVPQQLQPLPPGSIAVNAFGYGGTNAHALLQPAPADPAPALAITMTTTTTMACLTLSAHSAASLQRLAQRHADFMAASPSLADYAFTLAHHREALPYRLGLVAASPEEARRGLAAFAAGAPEAPVVTGTAAAELPCVFVYTGMGAQSWGMARALLAEAPFRAALHEVDALFQPLAGRSLLPLFERDDDAPMPEPQDAQPANFALQYALTALWRSLGVVPAAVVGHSVGEIAAAVAAGSLALADAVRLTYHRSRLQQALSGRGGMLAVGLSAEAVAPYLTADIVLAAINSVSAVTLAGPPAALEALHTTLDAAGVFCRALRVAVAYHSPQMDALESDFRQALADLRPLSPHTPLYSSVTGTRLAGGQDVDYWWRNCRQPVLFAAATAALLADGYRALVEVGPHPVLSAALAESLHQAGAAGFVGDSLRRTAPAREYVRQALLRLHVAGGRVDWHCVAPAGRCLTLPVYPWEHVAHWAEPEAVRQDRIGAVQHPLLQQREWSAGRGWQGDLNLVRLAHLRDHRLEGQPIFPASATLEAGLALLAHDQFRRGNALAGVELLRLLHLESAGVIQVHLAEEGGWTLHARPPGAEGDWTLYARGRIVGQAVPPRQASIDLAALRDRSQPVPDDLYARLQQCGLDYGPAFQRLRQVYRHDDGFLAELTPPDADADADADAYCLHPAVMDAGFQAFISLLAEDDRATRLLVPVAVGEVRYHAAAAGPVWCYGRVQHASAAAFTGDLTFCDATGTTLLEVIGLRVQARPRSGRPAPALADRLYTLTTEPLAAVPAAASADGPWLMVAPEATAAPLCAALPAAHVLTAAPADDAAALDHWLAQFPRPAGLVYLWGLPAAAVDVDEAAAGLAAGRQLLAWMQAILRAGIVPAQRLAIVTLGAQGPTAHPGQMIVWGLGRVFANEYPDAEITLIDLDPDDVAGSLRALPALLCAPLPEPELLYRGGQWHVNRFSRLGPPAPLPQPIPPETPVQLRIGQPGLLDSLHYEITTRRAPAPDEVEVRVQASGLNFKDILKALDLLPRDYLDSTFFGHAAGLEFAGEVLRVGSAVTEFAPGDAVVGMAAAGSFRTFCTTSAALLIRRPAHLSAAESVVFTNFITAYHALVEVARLQPGERVLIHSASGGVGQAALQLARWRGATIFATAGSADRRAALHDLGVACVSDSRSLRFVDDVRRWTDGRGVDVVLNVLTGEALQQSLGLLADFGRLVDIGKQDIMHNRRLAMQAFDRNLTFAAVDIDRMAQQRPQQVRALLETISDLFHRRIIQPLPLTTCPADDIGAAFRRMSQAQHTGKIVVLMQPGPATASPDPQQVLVRPDRTYLVTGGLSGLGLAAAEWLLRQGARHLVLLSRRGAQALPGLPPAFTAPGVHVHLVPADVAVAADVARVLADVRRAGPPLAGIIHSAMVLDDALLTELTPARLEAVLAPKVRGAWLLHQHTLHDPLDFFLLFSSISAVIGNPRQGNYVAANAFLDGLAHYRRAQGRPALSLNLGPVSEVGVVARNPAVAQHLARLGLTGLTPAFIMQAVGDLLRGSPPPQVSLVDVNWQQWRSSSMVGAESPRYRQLTAAVAVAETGAAGLPAELAQRPPADHAAHTLAFLLAQVARVTRHPLEQLDPDVPFDRLGLDSLMVLELNNLIRAHSGHDFSVTLLARAPTLRQLAAHLLERLHAPA